MHNMHLVGTQESQAFTKFCFKTFHHIDSIFLNFIACVVHRVHLVLPELKVTLERRESKELEATKDRKETEEMLETLEHKEGQDLLDQLDPKETG